MSSWCGERKLYFYLSVFGGVLGVLANHQLARQDVINLQMWSLPLLVFNGYGGFFPGDKTIVA